MLVWCPDLESQEGSKLAPPWTGPYAVEKRLSGTSYFLRSEQGGLQARVHTNRLRKITNTSRETEDPRDGVFPDSLRLLPKIGWMKEEAGHDGVSLAQAELKLQKQRQPHELPSSTNLNEHGYWQRDDCCGHYSVRSNTYKMASPKTEARMEPGKGLGRGRS